MTVPLGVIVAVDVEFEAAVVASLAQVRDLQVAARPADEIELIAVANAGAGNVIVLGAYFPGVDAEVVRRLRASSAAVVGFGTDTELFARWGIAHTVQPWAQTGEIVEVLQAAVSAEPGPPKPERLPVIGRTGGTENSTGAAAGGQTPQQQGRIVTVWGTGSAPGRSTVAHTLALKLSRHHRTVLVDADTVRASQAVYLGIHSDAPQLASFIRHAESLTADFTARTVSALNPRLDVITGLTRAQRWPEIKPAGLKMTLDHLQNCYQAVIVDVSDRIDPDDDYADPHYDRHAATRVSLDAADSSVLVGAGDPMGLKLFVDLLGTERARSAQTVAVINKTRASAVGRHPEKTIAHTLERFTGLQDPVFLPWAGADMDRAVLAGKALVEDQPRHPFSLAADALVARLPFETPPRRADSRPRSRRKRKIRL